MAYSAQNPFVVSKASAGSGKTFMLVKEYLKLSMTVSSSSVRHNKEAWQRELRRNFAGILAITFTNKAAGEMKQRVMEHLYTIAQRGADCTMGAQLLDLLNELPCYADKPLASADLQWMAEEVHSAVLHRYSDLSVCTIDSFMHRIVRTFAHDLNRPVGFEVMIEKEEMVAQAVERLMALIGTEGHEELTRVAQAYADSRMEEDKSYRIEGALTLLAEQLFKEGTDRYIEPLAALNLSDFIVIQKSLSEQNKCFVDRVKGCGSRMMQTLSSIGAADIDCAGGSKGYYSFFRGAAAGQVRPLTATTVKAFEGGKLYSSKCPQVMKDAIEEVALSMTTIYLELRELVGVAGASGVSDASEGEALRAYNTRVLLLRNLYAMAMLGALAEQMQAYAQEHEIIHLSEFNRMINDVVEDQPAPFIYERLGNRYRHYLIDEFQDTSVLQWHNLVPLIENGVSQRQESLVVGDGKQAIYRFRGGDVRQFAVLPRVEGMALHGQALSMEGNYSHAPLSTNRRTAKRIVEFNNDFFTWVLTQRPFVDNPLTRQIYWGNGGMEEPPELYQATPEEAADAGYVEVEFTDPDAPSDLYEYIRHTIVKLVSEQGYRQSDIMVLGRDNRDLDRISTYLQSTRDEMPIEVTSSESFFLTRSHAVMAIIATLRLLREPTDRVAAADLLQRLHNLGLVEKDTNDEFLESAAVDVARILRGEHKGFDLRLEYLATLDLYDCCEAIVRQLCLDGIDVAYVGSLLGRVSDFVSRRHEGVGAFLEWFDDNASDDFLSGRHRQLSAASPEGVDAVRLLTIHKAKGLEAPVVICPFFQRPDKEFRMWVEVDESLDLGGKHLPAAYVEIGRKSSTLFDGERNAEQQLDEVDKLNVLYVALTRAAEQLYIVCPQPAEKSDSVSVSYPKLIRAYLAERNPPLGAPPEHRADAGRPSRLKVADSVALRKVTFAEWTEKVSVASPAEQALVPLMGEQVRFGNWLHGLMAEVAYADDVEAALPAYCEQQAVPETDRQRLLQLAHDMVHHPDCKRFFRKGFKVKTECDLVDDQGICRPDRVVIADGETWVVDFKTGQDLGEMHDRQVRRYCQAMQSMGYNGVSGWLIYIGEAVKVRQVV